MEFNSINNHNINNISNQKAGLVQNSQNQNQTTAQNQLPQQTQIAQPFRTIDPTIFDFQLAKMDNETTLKYLQNLMKLPKSIDEFVNQLNSKNADPKITKILVENMISVKVLSEFLNKNSTEAIPKLMQVISNSLKSGISDVSQLKEILSILTTIQTSSTQSNQQINTNNLKELLLLYIPLNNPVFDRNINGEIQNNEEKEAIKNSKLSILLETISFGNILLIINESENNLYIDFFAPKSFPKENFIKIIEALSKEANIVSIIEFKEKQSETQGSVQNFKIISDGFISQNTLILSHLLIETIIKIDSNFT